MNEKDYEMNILLLKGIHNYFDEQSATIDKQKEEIERLNNRIDKAIEYIEHENFKRTILVGVSTKRYTRDILNNVLEILEGDNNVKD